MKKIFLTLFLVFLVFGSIFCQNDSIEITKIPEFESQVVRSVNQDINGGIWVLKNKSLVYYNGSSYDEYQLKDSSLFVGFAQDFVIDANGNLWLYSVINKEIKIFDTTIKKLKSFKEYTGSAPFNQANVLPNIYEDKNHNLYLTVKNEGLYKYDGKSFNLFFDYPTVEKSIIPYSSAQFDWFVHKNTVTRRNKKTLQKETFTNTSPYMLNSITEFKGQLIFGGYNRNSAIALTLSDNNEFKNFLPNYKLNRLNSLKQGAFQVFKEEYYIINTEKDIIILDYNKNSIARIDKSTLIEFKYLTGYFIDTFGNIWFHTASGLFKVKLTKKRFKNYFNGYSTRGIVKRDSVIYVGSYKGGLLTLKNGKERYKQISDNINPAVGLLYSKDMLWVVKNVTLFNYNFNTKHLNKFVIDSTPATKGPLIIKKHPKTGSVFIGSRVCLSKFEETTQKIVPKNYFKEFISKSKNISVRWLQEEGDRLWLGTSEGLFLMDEQERIIKHIGEDEGLPKGTIQHIFIENKNVMWLATNGGGLIKWERDSNIFKVFSKYDGLSHNNIYATYKDVYGFLWLPTDNGLNRFAPKTLYNTIYLPKDGLGHKEFNYLSHFQDEKGLLYFGGLSGLNVLNPRDFIQEDEEKSNYRIYIESINTLNEEKKIVDRKSTLLKNGLIELKNEGNYVDLNFNVIDFLNESPIQYQYKIEPSQSSFQTIDKPTISLSNLKKGKYKLYLKAQSSDGSWTNLKVPIKIVSDGNLILARSILLFVAILFLLLLPFYFMVYRKKNPQLIYALKSLFNKNKILSDTEQQPPLDVKDDNDLMEEKYTKWLNELNSIVLKNISSVNFSLEFLAQELGLSERQLQRRIKSITQQTPNKYITEIRLNEAYRLIEHHEVKSVKELSKKVGYSTTDYFSKLFKNKFGKSPSDYLNF